MENMTVREELKAELATLVADVNNLYKLAAKPNDWTEFGAKYQHWYSRALKVVEALAPERLEEFKNYYLTDPKRKSLAFSNYTIQDYIKAVGPAKNVYGEDQWDTNLTVQLRVTNQGHILSSLSTRIDSVIEDVTGHLFAELQDDELRSSANLLKISPRAAGALAGVVLERHLQRVSKNHGITIRKKNPTISDLNDPLKEKGVYGIPLWRKIQLLADIRNLCSHNKEANPTIEQVEELIDGTSSIIKSVF